MNSTAQALLSCVLLLCALLEGILCRSGHCTGKLCSFETLGDFQDSKKACEDTHGDLFKFRPEEDTKGLTSAVRGLAKKYWVHNTFTAGAENCSAVSVMKGRSVAASWEPCGTKLDGFLCHYNHGESCSRLQAPAGAEVRYRTTTGFEVTDSETFPLGMWAETRKAGGEHLDARYMCAPSSGWQRAPWKCEVMGGGCEESCSPATDTCACPEGQIIHANNITCTSDGAKNYKLAKDEKSYENVQQKVNVCEERNPCTAEGEKCTKIQGEFKCECIDDFERENGQCVNVSICSKCEHMDCRKFNGVYQCFCRKGFKVSDKDPTKCEQDCTERDCPASCPHSTDQCFCPDGYVSDMRDNTTICTDINECEHQPMCDHRCENTYGSYRCLCDEGFWLQGRNKCVKEDYKEDGSGSSTEVIPRASIPATIQPATLPSYIKTGSVLGISVFMVLCVVLLYFLARSMSKRCKTIHLYTFKPPDIDIFYLQQVTTDTYKRFSFDKQIRNDSQRL
ncbi:thrombomodulin-like [Mugil cephalus]|uniref:thrombomodulin-like n=1 Tax=Mugil cephalus TaxID=48193 RepID=UPI001FB6742D|nr:thrombomodulin-like [Mugil cephalus]